MIEDNIPEVVESQKVQVMTSIWLVPITALIIALWLAWQYFSELGPKVEIVFKSSAGLKIDQSQVKMRDVPIGVVKDISLLDDKKGVLVTVRLKNSAKKYLNDDTKFWIAKPQISSRGISGLDTIMSGSYIEMYAKPKEGSKRYFEGLEEPYIDKEETPGRRYHLSASDSRDLSSGANVYYRKIKVGQLENLHLSKDGQKVDFTVFIQEPYTKFVNPQTQFYRTNNLSFDFSASRFKVDVAPISNILNGGIAFSTTTKTVRNNTLDDKYVFKLYNDFAEARQKVIGFGGEAIKTYQFVFDEPIGKLEIGAPIEFYGFEVGHVVNIESDFDSNKSNIRSVVIGVIDTSVFIDLTVAKGGEQNLEDAVMRGLKARLAQTDPITQTLYIELAKDKKGKPKKIFPTNKYAIFPTMHSNFNGMMDKISTFTDKLNSLDLERLLNSINTLIDDSSPEVKKLLANLNTSVENINKITKAKGMKNLPQTIDRSIRSLTQTLNSVNMLLQGDSSKSLLSAEITTMLRELTKMSRSVQRLTDKLDKKPNALIFGDE
jgi:paraquat-inducible protein B